MTVSSNNIGKKLPESTKYEENQLLKNVVILIYINIKCCWWWNYFLKKKKQEKQKQNFFVSFN